VKQDVPTAHVQDMLAILTLLCLKRGTTGFWGLVADHDSEVTINADS